MIPGRAGFTVHSAKIRAFNGHESRNVLDVYVIGFGRCFPARRAETVIWIFQFICLSGER